MALVRILVDGYSLLHSWPGLAPSRARHSAAARDELIQRHTQHWRLERMAAVDRNVLRASVAEFLGRHSTPRPVIINEALEIARKFSSPESVQFINGVLDSVGKEIEAQASGSRI